MNVFLVGEITVNIRGESVDWRLNSALSTHYDIDY